ncbi:Major facilitator superfamily domain, general substrate transporter [Penicillium expansum]|uniref:Major facilitator superfamily domain, general substrate transporter n=1 Tax=Penicillium expansum TaxID=27334 RepID=A0A0A2J322_PENEN|nr:Major facilitator superfamily domain, general substrate transporter [Penicillium expansum]KGO49171.1 Major facilitator superfamily domain, general substrate transporter [Penicillium expansum]KGO53925.1 Major facilitator superfamily domain, general substrate transporter [Penicillium expansum]
MADLKDVEAPQNTHSEDKDAAAFEMDDVKDPKLQNKRNETVMDAELLQLEEQVHSLPRSRFEMTLSNPVIFTYILVAFASMGGMLSGLDQSLISGASLYLPIDLGLSSADNSLVNAGMPLGAVFGALLSPANEYLGRRMAIIVSCILYTIGAALAAGAINFGMVFAGRFILGAGVGLEGGTVPVYIAECGEVLGYAIAAMFLSVEGNWRYILGSSLVFSTILFVGMLFLPESHRFLMHKGRVIEAYAVWKMICGFNDFEAKDEFLVMLQAVTAESQ